MSNGFDLSQYGITVGNVYRNPSPAKLYEDAITFEHASITSAGALMNSSGKKTGRSPKDKRIVEFQIRTKEMHEYADRGLAASFYYNEQKLTENYKKGKIEHLPTNLLWITELQMTAARLREGKKVDLKKLKLNLFSDKIFVYTPKGDIIDLPKGSLPLDFAYRLHSEIGDHVVGVKINGKMSNLNKKLEHGDVVEILTSKNQTPKQSWLDKIFTSHARSKLMRALRPRSNPESKKKRKPRKV